MKRILSISALALLMTWNLAMADDADSTRAEEPDSVQAADDGKVTTELGVTYKDLEIGKGDKVEMGSKAKVHYTLWLDDGAGEKGKRLQSSKDRGQPFVCTVGFRLIPGWSDGMIGMQAGGVRQLWIPSSLAYGPRGMPPVIPANADIIFEIELLEIME